MLTHVHQEIVILSVRTLSGVLGAHVEVASSYMLTKTLENALVNTYKTYVYSRGETKLIYIHQLFTLL